MTTTAEEVGSGLREHLHSDDLAVIYAPNMLHVYTFGDQWGIDGYIVAESFEDAYMEALNYWADRQGECDHGGDLPPELTGEAAWAWIESHCDCTQDEQGRWVWDVYGWMNELRLPVGMFQLAIGEEGDLGWLTD